ncbi:DUF262 domain-containing protein [Chryseobacterium sp. cx-311]|uniref:DUF262 domain-containing protein n=1 Tax=Marnyiella aurantia TaxID=2758037 RepID=UPI001AE60939|nr:DUF262 domain-containing protein [Marnyiella aurantia]MBP0613674.1 DUF262 domain-containing protein [Marnyiella aurantia]
MKKNTFWKIISAHGIEIPPIQRDYAQGRETTKAKKVRTSFLNSIFTSLRTNKQLSLDFVYGKIYGIRNEEEHRRNKQAIQSLINSVRDYALTIDLNIENIEVAEKSKEQSELIYLIPLDGQQRLTTLFLIHWYIAKRIGGNRGIETLKKFRYKTRKSSTACLNLLTDHDTKLSFLKEEVQSNLRQGSFYKEIIDLEFFSNSWLSDPTVQAMLNMLQAIHYRAQDLTKEELEGFWSSLTESDLLKFDFLDLQDLNLSDDLYVKMNARGKELSSFENFKAWLFGKIEEDKWLDGKRWDDDYRSKFDIEWNDVFWNAKGANTFHIDEAYYRFFKRLILIDITKYSKISGTSFLRNDKDTTDLLLDDKENVDFDFENYYSELTQNPTLKEGKINALIRHRLTSYFNTIDKYSKFSRELELADNEENIYFKQFWFTIQSKTTWIDLIRNYITLSFIEHNGERLSENNLFKDYSRVMLNLFNNQTFDSALLYKNAFYDITLINQYLKTNNCDIYNWLENIDRGKNIVFTDDQLNEEIRKWALIKDDIDSGNEVLWIDLISKAESHTCWKGKIQFLLNISNGDKEKFQRYYQKIAPLFNFEILDHKEKLLQRALLTHRNYFDKKNSDTYYLLKSDISTYRARRENWLGFLSKNNASEIYALISETEYNYKNVEDSLRKIISNYIDSNSLDVFIAQPIENIEFHKLYIYCESLFEYGESKFIKLEKGKYAYQLNKTSTGGYFNDVILEFIKNHYFADDKHVKINRTTGWVNSPSIEVGNRFVKVVPSQNKIIVTEDDNTVYESTTIKEIVEYVKA